MNDPVFQEKIGQQYNEIYQEFLKFNKEYYRGLVHQGLIYSHQSADDYFLSKNCHYIIKLTQKTTHE